MRTTLLSNISSRIQIPFGSSVLSQDWNVFSEIPLIAYIFRHRKRSIRCHGNQYNRYITLFMVIDKHLLQCALFYVCFDWIRYRKYWFAQICASNLTLCSKSPAKAGCGQSVNRPRLVRPSTSRVTCVWWQVQRQHQMTVVALSPCRRATCRTAPAVCGRDDADGVCVRLRTRICKNS